MQDSSDTNHCACCASKFAAKDLRTKVLLTSGPAAKLIGCYPWTLRRAVKRGEIPVYHFSGRDRFCVSEIVAHIKASKKGGERG